MPVFPYQGRQSLGGVAVRVFPVLKKWGLKTRDIPLYPIGCDASRKTFEKLGDMERQRCVSVNARSLYHDLGVVAFDGCTYQQTQKIGQILADTVALGGPAGLAMRSSGGFRKMSDRLELPATFPDGDEGRPFDFTSSVEHFREAAVSHLRDHFRRKGYGDKAEVEFVESKTVIAIPADKPSPFHDTAYKRRLLPVDVYWRIRPVSNHVSNTSHSGVMIDMSFYSVGTGLSLGTVSLACRVRSRAADSSQDDDGGDMSKAETMFMADIAEQDIEVGAGSSESDVIEVALGAFQGIWELERQTWSGRAEDIPHGSGLEEDLLLPPESLGGVHR